MDRVAERGPAYHPPANMPHATLPDLYFAHLDKGVFTWLPARLLSKHFAIGLHAEILVLETSLASFPDRPNWERRALVVQPTGSEEGRELSFKCQGVVASESPPGVIIQIEPTYLIVTDWKQRILKDHFRVSLEIQESIANCSPDSRLTDRGWDCDDA